MRKVGCLTFHASHNYGSCLQAYALQRVIKDKFGDDIDYRIINFRIKVQKDFYRSIFEKKDAKSIYSRLFFLFGKKALKEKYLLFEKFIEEDLNITKEISDIDELEKKLNDYDLVLVGSDQVWNVNAFDYSEAYFLPFEGGNWKRCTYAVSIGSRDNICDLCHVLIK